MRRNRNPEPRLCKHCGTTLAGHQRDWCTDKPACQDARAKDLIRYQHDYAAKNKPWRKPPKKSIAEPPVKAKRYCQYEYCPYKKVPLPEPYRYFHPNCHKRKIEILDRGLDTAYEN